MISIYAIFSPTVRCSVQKAHLSLVDFLSHVLLSLSSCKSLLTARPEFHGWRIWVGISFYFLPASASVFKESLEPSSLVPLSHFTLSSSPSPYKLSISRPRRSLSCKNTWNKKLKALPFTPPHHSAWARKLPKLEEPRFKKYLDRNTSVI